VEQGYFKPLSDEEQKINSESPIREDEDEGEDQDYSKKRKKRTKEDIEKEALLMGDLYAILDLENKANDCTEAQIAKAYRKAALLCHPDKLGDKLTEKDKEVWLKIQTAYDTLIDPVKKKKYDSSLPFDEKVPKMSDCENAADFYEKFGKCFTLNAKWSVNKPVPNLGDANKDLQDVKDFYRFWDGFKSWREFSQYDEYDTEDAQDRYEKRWMEKQNAKTRASYIKEERKRIFNFVNHAYDNDPRIKAWMAKEEEEK